MTDKQIVNDFLQFLNTRDGLVVGYTDAYTYKELREAIINCLEQAMEDGYKKGCRDTEAAELFDKTLISGGEDW